MKLNVNPKELLALYNLLHAKVEQRLEVNDEGDDVHLRQVYNRLRAITIAALTNKAIDPVDSWLKHEQEKVNRLNSQVDAVNKSLTCDTDQRLPHAPGDILTDDDDEVQGELAYPLRRKGPPPPHVPRPGRYGRRK